MTNDEIDVLMDDFVDNGLFVDIYDFKFRNDAVLNYDVEDKLENIKAKSLILGVDGYLNFNLKEYEQMKDSIENSKMAIFRFNESYYESADYNDLGIEIISFLKQLK